MSWKRTAFGKIYSWLASRQVTVRASGLTLETAWLMVQCLRLKVEGLQALFCIPNPPGKVIVLGCMLEGGSGQQSLHIVAIMVSLPLTLTTKP